MKAALLPLSWLLLLTASTAHAKVVSYALVIGYNQPPDALKDALATLRYADDDALRYAAHFDAFTEKTWLLSALDEETQTRFSKAAARTQLPTWKAIEAALEEIKRRSELAIAREDEVIFYFAYSGHGARDKNGNYFLTLKDGGITQQALYERIVAAVPAKYHHLVIDACHAEAIVGARGMFDKEKNAKIKDTPTFTQQTYRERFPSVGTIVGTTIDNETHEWSKIQAGVFTHAVLSALAGAADVNTDGRVEYSELQAFVASATRTFTDPRNRPRVVAMPPKANLRAPLLDRVATEQDAFILTGRAGSLGHFYIELENGQRVLDANMGSDMPLSLALPKGQVAFLRNATSEAQIDMRNMRSVRLEQLLLRPLGTASRGSIESDYRTAYFAAPFSVSYYRGFVDSAGVVSVDFSTPQVDVSLTIKPKGQLAESAVSQPTNKPALVGKLRSPVLTPSSARKRGAIAGFVLGSVFTVAAIGMGIGMGIA